MKKILIALAVLAALAGGGFGTWWFFVDAEPRSLRNLNGFNEDEQADAWAWISSHGDRPAVRQAIGELLGALLNESQGGQAANAWQSKMLARMDVVFGKDPITEPLLATRAMTAMARFARPSMLAWVKDEVVTAALKTALEELPKGYQQAAPAEAGVLLTELGKRGVAPDSKELVRGVVQCWLRFRAPAARAPFEHARTEYPAEFQAALIDRLIHGTNYSALEPSEEEAEILVNELGALKPELDRELLQAIARLSDRKATPRLLQTWGPASVQAMRDARSSFETYAQTEADTLLAKLGGGGEVEAGAVQRKIASLNAYAYDEPVMREPDDGDSLLMITSCSHQFSSRVESVVPRIAKELADFPKASLLQAWNGSDDLLTMHLVARALAHADPEQLALALEPLWAQFAPVARAAESARLVPSRIDPLTVSAYRRLAPRLWEGLAALAELEKPSPAALRHLWPAVSSPSGQLSRTAISLLDRSLADDEFVLGLFGYFDLRSSYSNDEISGWIDLMSKREQSQKLLGKTMGRLADAVGGVEALPMVHKLVGLSALSKSKCGCEAVLKRFAADTTSYDSVRFKENDRGEQSDRTVTVQRFADLAKAALAR